MIHYSSNLIKVLQACLGLGNHSADTECPDLTPERVYSLLLVLGAPKVMSLSHTKAGGGKLFGFGLVSQQGVDMRNASALS